MDTIEQLWRDHLATPFPGRRGDEVEEIDLVTLDADIAGCVDAFISAGHVLDAARTAILGRCYRDASIISRTLTGAEGQYFARLESLAGEVLKKLSVLAPAG